MLLLDGRFRFDNYVVGAANRLAVAAARAVAESPGAVYNPLFIYSGSGLGKTHLIGAIGHAAALLQPDLRVAYVQLDEFVDQLHRGVSSGQVDAFKQRYQEVDLLLIDDVQFLTGRRETQSEMLRLFNALQGKGRQIVMASDRPPTEIADVDERLLTRLSGGLIVDIGVPEFETKVAILRNKCGERHLAFAAGVLEELAHLPFANVRELQGALNRLVAHQAIGDRPLTPAEVRAIVGGMRTPTPLGMAAIRPPASETVGDEFASFLSDVAVVVAQQVEGWRVRLGERIAHWKQAGYRTAMLERALEAVTEPEVEQVESAFGSAVARLHELEAEAASLDPSCAGDAAFRDPERIAEAEARLERAIAEHDPPPGPSPVFTREGFVAGPSNQMAVRAADTVIAEPGTRYNPLYVHGASGTGKTHFVHALGGALRESGTLAGPVACLTGARFVDELIAAIQDGTVERWRARYRAAGALIVDGVHALAGKERSQDELFHLFNILHGSGRQVILTSDRPAGEIAELAPRLRSRFDGGLVVALQAHDRTVRAGLYARALADVGAADIPAIAPILAEDPAADMPAVRERVRQLAAAAAADGQTLGSRWLRRHLGLASSGEGAVVETGVADPFFLDAEKVVLDWADLDGRVIEELR